MNVVQQKTLRQACHPSADVEMCVCTTAGTALTSLQHIQEIFEVNF
jgi:hypothetical protein